MKCSSAAAFRLIAFLAVALALTGCITAQEAEQRDDNICANARDYGICRQNLMSQRRDRAILLAN